MKFPKVLTPGSESGGSEDVEEAVDGPDGGGGEDVGWPGEDARRLNISRMDCNLRDMVEERMACEAVW